MVSDLQLLKNTIDHKVDQTFTFSNNLQENVIVQRGVKNLHPSGVSPLLNWLSLSSIILKLHHAEYNNSSNGTYFH